MARKLLLRRRNPSMDLSLKLSASTAKGLVTGSGTAPSIWRIRRMAKWKVYFIYMLLMCTLLMLVVASRYLILVLLLIFATRNRGLRIKRRLAKDEVTMCAGNGSKVDVIAVGTLPLHLPSGLLLDLNNYYLVPALSMNIIYGCCLMWDGYSFKSENSVSEHRNHTLLDMVRSMMSLTDLPLSFWGYALQTAAFTLNRAPSKSVETTPYELWFGKKPKLSFLKVWGCDTYVKRL